MCFLPEKEGTPWVVYYYKVGYWTVYEGEEELIKIEQKASENLSKIPMNEIEHNTLPLEYEQNPQI